MAPPKGKGGKGKGYKGKGEGKGLSDAGRGCNGKGKGNGNGEGRRQGHGQGRTARRRAKARAEARARGNGNGCNSDGRPMQLWWVWQPMWVVVPVLAPAPQASTGGPLEFAPVGRPRRPRPGLWLLRSELQEAVARAQWDLQVWQFEEVVTPTGVWCLWHV